MKLPDKPSELIELALADLAKCEADPKFRISMCCWVAPMTADGVCEVCLAGAVMVGSLGADSNQCWIPDDFDTDVNFKLRALDMFRCGQIRRGLDEMGCEKSYPTLDWMDVGSYVDPSWHSNMQKIISVLKENGL